MIIGSGRIRFFTGGKRSALRFEDWKLVRNPARGADGDWQVYNLGNDREEQHDLAPSRPKLLAELIAKWESLNGQMAVPFWSPSK